MTNGNGREAGPITRTLRAAWNTATAESAYRMELEDDNARLLRENLQLQRQIAHLRAKLDKLEADANVTIERRRIQQGADDAVTLLEHYIQSGKLSQKHSRKLGLTNRRYSHARAFWLAAGWDRDGRVKLPGDWHGAIHRMAAHYYAQPVAMRRFLPSHMRRAYAFGLSVG